MTLRAFRDASGKTLPMILEELSALCPDAPKTKGGFLNIERRGVKRRSLIRALATVYGTSEDAIESAQPVPSELRRGRRSREVATA